MFEEFALLEAFVALVGFLITLDRFRGAIKYLSIALLSDAVSNILYIIFQNSDVFTANTFVICAMTICFCQHIKRRRRVL
jgi:uncharacterized membrane protein